MNLLLKLMVVVWTVTVSILLLVLLTALIMALTTHGTHAQQSLEPGWQITVYLPIKATDPTPDTTKNIITIGPRHFDRQICRDLLPAIREHFKGARRIDCE